MYGYTTGKNVDDCRPAIYNSIRQNPDLKIKSYFRQSDDHNRGQNSLGENPIAQLADSHNYYCRLIYQNYNAMWTKIYKKPIGEL